MSGGTFLDMAQDLIDDVEAKAAFDADPDGFLAERGFEGLSPADVTDAVGFVADTLPAEAAQQLTVPDGDDGDGLARLARLDPGEGTDAPPADLLDGDPSGELDMLDEVAVPPAGASGHEGPAAEEQEATMPADTPTDDGLDPDPVARHHVGADESRLDPLEETAPEPGFGVGFEAGDADDVTAASPEFANVLDHPADLDLDLTHVPELAFEATDPISEAISWADDQETAADHASAIEHDAGHDLHHGDVDHHPDGDDDGHLDL